MSRLRNRIVKADFWTDPELLRWPALKRFTYQGLWAIAEDSGCIEDDPFGWKVQLWPSPMDSEVSVELLTAWRDELVAAKKLLPYEAEGKCYLYVRTFHDHEAPRNPQSPNLPLPLWVSWVESRDSKDRTRGCYEVDKATLLSQYCDATTVPVLSGPAQPSPAQSGASARAREASSQPVDNLVALALTELPASESTKEDYQRTVDRYRDKLSDEHIERIIYDLAAKPKYHDPKKKLHATLAAWLNKEPRDALRPEHKAFKPAAEQTPAEREAAKVAAKEAVERVRAMTGQQIGRPL